MRALASSYFISTLLEFWHYGAVDLIDQGGAPIFFETEDPFEPALVGWRASVNQLHEVARQAYNAHCLRVLKSTHGLSGRC
jgi:hypothetical protein